MGGSVEGQLTGVSVLSNPSKNILDAKLACLRTSVKEEGGEHADAYYMWHLWRRCNQNWC